MTQNRQSAPEIFPIAGLPDFNIEKQLLDNQIPIKYIDAGSQELTKLQIVFPAGISYQEKSLQAYFTGKMLKEGSQNYSASQLAETIDFYGAFLDVKVTRDHSIIHLISLNKHLDKILALIVDFLTQPLFLKRELSVIKDLEKQKFLHRLQKVKNQAQRAFTQEIFGNNHPYGKHAAVEDFDQISQEHLQSFFRKFYQISNAKIYLGGMVSSKILNTLNLHFGNIKSFKCPLVPMDMSVNQSPQKDILIEKKVALQTAIRMGKLCMDRKAEDFPAFALTQTILGGFFGSRLMQNIREDKGYTYGIHSNVQHLKHASVFSIASEVGSDLSLLAMDEIDHELKNLRVGLVPDNELSLVKNYMSGSLLRSLNGPFSLGEMIKMLDEYDLEDNYYRNFLIAIQVTSSEKIRNIAQKYLHEDSMTRVRVGK